MPNTLSVTSVDTEAGTVTTTQRTPEEVQREYHEALAMINSTTQNWSPRNYLTSGSPAENYQQQAAQLTQQTLSQIASQFQREYMGEYEAELVRREGIIRGTQEAMGQQRILVNPQSYEQLQRLYPQTPETTTAPNWSYQTTYTGPYPTGYTFQDYPLYFEEPKRKAKKIVRNLPDWF